MQTAGQARFATLFAQPLAELRLKADAGGVFDWLLLLIWTCLARTMMRMDTMFLQWLAGTLAEAPAPHARTPRPRTNRNTRKPTDPDLVRFLKELDLRGPHPDAAPAPLRPAPSATLAPEAALAPSTPPTRAKPPRRTRKPVDRWPRAKKQPWSRSKTHADFITKSK
jgi:hypothetical protein